MGDSTGLTIKSGPWSRQQILAYLDEAAIPIRLASSGGYPMVQSLWFLADDDALWCATRANSVLASRLRASDRCGFEISADAPPYKGVRGRGHATLVPELAANVLPRLIDRYLGAAPSSLAAWLMSRIDDEVAVRIDRLTVTSWDYSDRM